MNWAPYTGDTVLETLTPDQVKDDFGWNNFPIYEYREGMKRFVRVRIQEQLVGLWISQSKDVDVQDSTVEALQIKIGGRLYPLQADGMTLNRVSGIVVRGSRFAKTWEGIDFTGGGGDNFTFEDCVVEDILGWVFKVAHPKQKGRMIRCRAVWSGLGGFTLRVKSEDMSLVDCVAEETGAPGYWTSSTGKQLMVVAGMRIDREDNLPRTGGRKARPPQRSFPAAELCVNICCRSHHPVRVTLRPESRSSQMPTTKKTSLRPSSRNPQPKHALLSQALEREIRQLPPGTLISPVLELMERFGLSQGTVVHALRHLRTRGLITKLPGKKRLVVTGREKTRDAVLSVLAMCPNWSSPDYNTMLQALADEARRQRFAIETVHYGTEWGAGGTANLEPAIEAHDAVVVLPSSLPNDLAAILKQTATPAVMLFEEGLANGMMCVEDDDEAAGRLATEYLLKLGHRRIAAFQSEPPQRRMNNRLAGWKQAMIAAGERCPERLIIDGSVKPGFDSIVGSYEKFRRLLYQKGNQLEATAIFCLHWTGAMGVLRALKEVGIQVPHDVSVIAHAGENRLTEFTNPALTVVRGDPEAVAREALGLLKTACLGDTPAKRTIHIGQSIVERESTLRL